MECGGIGSYIGPGTRADWRVLDEEDLETISRGEGEKKGHG